MLMVRGCAERGRATGRTVTAILTINWRQRPEISGELSAGMRNTENRGLSAGMGPWDLGGLYAPKGGTLRWW
jgi:hypothetical protein